MTFLPQTDDSRTRKLPWLSYPWRRYLPMVLAVGAVVGATAAGVVAARRWEGRAAAARLADVARGAVSALTAGIEKPVASLRSAASCWAAAGKVDGPSFHAMAKVLQSQVAGVEAVAWAPRVADADRAAFEAAVRADGPCEFRISDRTSSGEPLAAARRQDYYPVRFFGPIPSDAEVSGFDLGSAPGIRQAMDQACRTGEPAATERTALFHPDDGRLRVLVFQAVYRQGAQTDSAESRAANLQGFVAAIVRVGDLVEAAAGPLKENDLIMHLYDETAPAGKRFVCRVILNGPDSAVRADEQESPPERPAPHYVGALTLAGRPWEVVCTPGPGGSRARAWAPWAVGTGGLVVAGLLTAGLVAGPAYARRARRAARQLRVAKRRIEEAATIDRLTGVNTGRRITEMLEIELSRARRQKADVAVALFHVDHLRQVNSTLGHAKGDQALADVAALLRDSLRPKDRIGRHAANEFLVFMPETPVAEAVVIAEQVRKKLAQRHLAPATGVAPITVSVGLAAAGPGGTDTVESLVSQADRALAVAKGAGRNCTRISGDVPGHCRTLIDQSPDVIALRGTLEYRAGQAKDAFVDSMGSTIEAIDARDPHARHHSANAARYAVGTALVLGLGEEEIGAIRRAAMLHDIGNIAIPRDILQKTGILTNEERRIVEQHVMIGVGLLGSMRLLDQEISIVRQHHERWDGRGYPDGIRRDAIPIGARVLAVADAFDAITSDRSYRKARDVGEAIDILLEESERQFDPDVADALICWVRSAGAGAVVRAAASAAD